MLSKIGPSRVIHATTWLRRRTSEFLPAATGVAAVEFALILPLMLIIYFGVAELTTAVSTDRKLTLLSRSLADLVGRSTSISNSERDAIFDAAVEVMRPYDGSLARMTVSSIVVRQKPNSKEVEGRVCWSEPRNGTKLPDDQIVTVPEGFKIANTSFILAYVQYD